MPTFSSQLDTKSFKQNVVVYFKTRAKYFAIDEPDSGLTVDATRRGISAPKLSPSSLSVEDVKTTFQSFTFNVTDKSLAMTAEMASNENVFMNEQVEVYIGRLGVAMAFSDYFQLPTMRIKSFTYKENEYRFQTESIDATFKRPSFKEGGVLNADTSAGAGSIVLSSAISGFPSAGKLLIDDGDNSEILAYSSYTSATFTLTGVTAFDHSEGAEIWNNDTVAGNPVDIAMQLIAGGTDAVADTIDGAHSASGTTLTATTDLSAWPATGLVYIVDGTDSEFVEYTSISGLDITLVSAGLANAHGGGEVIQYALRDGLKVDPLLFDQSEIQTLRDTFFLGESFSLELHNIQDTLKYIEDELWKPNNLRFTTNFNGLYTFAILDQTGFAGTTISFTTSNVVGSPTFKATNREVRTTVRLNYGYNYETKTYSTFLSSQDANAFANYGDQEPFVVNARGIPDSAAGDLIASDRVTRWLERLSTTRPIVMLKTHFSEFDANIGTGVRVDLALPDETGSLGFNKDMEVSKRTIDFKTNEIKWELTSTSETGLRRSFISPSDVVVSAPSTSSITVASGRGAQYSVGWEMAFITTSTRASVGNVVGILSIVGDTITFDGLHGASTSSTMRFADYDLVVADQRRFAFISPNGTNFVSDGLPPYQIIF